MLAVSVLVLHSRVCSRAALNWFCMSTGCAAPAVLKRSSRTALPPGRLIVAGLKDRSEAHSALRPCFAVVVVNSGIEFPRNAPLVNTQTGRPDTGPPLSHLAQGRDAL